MWDWIRNRVKNAVLAGFADAIDHLSQPGLHNADEGQRLLEERIRLLPSPEDDRSPESRQGGRKGKAS